MDDIFETNEYLHEKNMDFLNSPYFIQLNLLLMELLKYHMWDQCLVSYSQFSDKNYRDYIKKNLYNVYGEINLNDPMEKLDKMFIIDSLKEYIENYEPKKINIKSFKKN